MSNVEPQCPVARGLTEAVFHLQLAVLSLRAGYVLVCFMALLLAFAFLFAVIYQF